MRSDLDLLNGVRDGDWASLRMLVHRYHVGVFNFFFSLSADRAQALDLAHSVFVVLLKQTLFRMRGGLPESAQLPPPPWSRGPGAAEPVRVSAYVYRIAYVCWCAHARRAQAAAPVTVNTAQSSAGEPLPSPAFARGSEQSLFRELPAHLRPLLALKDVSGLSYADVAVASGEDLAAVHAHLHSAYLLLAATPRQAAEPGTGRELGLSAMPPATDSAGPDASGPARP